MTTILLVEVGSTAHGTGLPGGEDHDEMGVVVEPPEAGARPRRARLPHGHAADAARGVAIRARRHRPHAALAAPLRSPRRLRQPVDPHVVLGARRLHATDEGQELRALGDAFVGRHVVPRYRGYMQSQAMRLLGLRGGGHGRRGGGQREELIAAHGYDTKYAMHCARLGFQCIELLTTGELQLPIQGEPAEWLRAVRRGEVPFDEWWTRSLDLDGQLEQLARTSPSPKAPTGDGSRPGRWRPTSPGGADRGCSRTAPGLPRGSCGMGSGRPRPAAGGTRRQPRSPWVWIRRHCACSPERPDAAADEEAEEYGPPTFEELGLDVCPRRSKDAVIEGARLRAVRFLSGEGSGRELARDLWRSYVAADYPDELAGFAGLDDYYDMIEHGVIADRLESADAATEEAAKALVERREHPATSVAERFVARPGRQPLRRDWCACCADGA